MPIGGNTIGSFVYNDRNWKSRCTTPTVKPLIGDPPRQGQCITDLSTRDTACGSNYLLSLQFQYLNFTTSQQRTTSLQRTKQVNLYCPQLIPCLEVPLYLNCSAKLKLSPNWMKESSFTISQNNTIWSPRSQLVQPNKYIQLVSPITYTMMKPCFTGKTATTILMYPSWFALTMQKSEKELQTNRICGTLNQRQILHKHFKWCTQAHPVLLWILQGQCIQVFEVSHTNTYTLHYSSEVLDTCG